MAKMAIGSEVLEQVLAPYKPDCRYLKSAFLESGEARDDGNSGPVVLSGTCEIARSCYIDDTGHFNAVEFNICYNQLAYCLVATCAQYELLNVFEGWNFDQFKRRQLPDMLIAEFSSAFRKPMKAAHFEGRVSIEKASMNRKGTIFLSTVCSFFDSDGGNAEGKVLIAIVNQDGAVRERRFPVTPSRDQAGNHGLHVSYSAAASRNGA
jgi:hypothetical protein